MSLIDTTNTVDTSIYLKAKLANNMVGDNWYISNLQDKRNQDWDYRYNVINIEEELNKQVQYTKEMPCYTPIDAVIQTVKNDRGKALGDDWASLSFRDLKHPNEIGGRYRFDFSYQGEGMQDLSTMSEEEKYYNTSIWLAVNKSGISAGNALVCRRCNTNVAICGSPTRNRDNITEVRYEPGVLENELKLINIYYNQTTVVPQAEWYLTMQLNYFTNFIEINDRLILGGVDLQDESNNTIFKVKAIVKANSKRTFAKLGSAELENIPLIIIGLDRDLAGEKDDFYRRVAVEGPIYPIPVQDDLNDVPKGDYVIDMEDPNDNIVLLGSCLNKKVYLANAYEKLGEDKVEFNYYPQLNGIPEEQWDEYFSLTVTDKGFYLKNYKKYSKDYLVIKCVARLKEPQGVLNDLNIDATYEEEFRFELGGFY